MYKIKSSLVVAALASVLANSIDVNDELLAGIVMRDQPPVRNGVALPMYYEVNGQQIPIVYDHEGHPIQPPIDSVSGKPLTSQDDPAMLEYLEAVKRLQQGYRKAPTQQQAAAPAAVGDEPQVDGGQDIDERNLLNAQLQAAVAVAQAVPEEKPEGDGVADDKARLSVLMDILSNVERKMANRLTGEGGQGVSFKRPSMPSTPSKWMRAMVFLSAMGVVAFCLNFVWRNAFRSRYLKKQSGYKSQTSRSNNKNNISKVATNDKDGSVFRPSEKLRIRGFGNQLTPHKLDNIC